MGGFKAYTRSSGHNGSASLSNAFCCKDFILRLYVLPPAAKDSQLPLFNQLKRTNDSQYVDSVKA